MPDELEYSEMAKSFASTGHFLFRTQPSPLFSLYPALIAPAWRAGSMHTTYELAKAINVVAMTSAAVPFYLWARRLAGGWFAVLGTVLFLTLPIFAYTGTLMTENLSFPLFMLAFFAVALMLERPAPLRQLFALAVIGLACMVRYQALVLFLVLVLAILLKLAIDVFAGATPRSWGRLGQEARRYWLVVALLVAGALAYGLLKVAEGQSLSSGLRAYGSTLRVHYSIRDVLRWSVYHAAELVLAVGMFPAFALVVLLVLTRAEWVPTAAERAYLAVTLAALPLILVEVGAYASRYSLRIEERNSFYLEPLLLLALVVWLARGLPRPPALVAVGVLVPVALLVTLPLETLFNPALLTDTFGFTPFYRLAGRLNGGVTEVRTLIGLGGFAAGLLFVALPRRIALWAIPLAVGLFLGLSSRSVFGNETYIANATRHAGGLTGDPSWIDHAIGSSKRVEFLYTTDIDRDQHILWQSEIWNRSVRRVFGVTSQDPSIADISAPLDSGTGRIAPVLPAGSPDLHPRYVVAASAVDVAGTRIAQAGFLSLTRVNPPLGLASLTAGIYPDGWSTSTGTYVRYVPLPSAKRLEVKVSRPGPTAAPPAKVTVTVGRLRAPKGSPVLGKVWARKAWTVKGTASHVFSLPLRPEPFVAQLSVSPTFSATLLNPADARQLGVVPTFTLR